MTNVAVKIRATDKLKKWLDLKEMSQRDLANQMNVKESFLSQILSGTKHPSFQMLRKIYLITGLNIGDVIEFTRTIKD